MARGMVLVAGRLRRPRRNYYRDDWHPRGHRGPVDPARLSLSPGLIVVVFIFGLTVSGGLNEEPGWRGFAQPYLIDRYRSLTASPIIGVVRALWHLPYFFISITPHSDFTLVNQVGWFLGIVLLSIILAWACNNTGSVLIVMVIHAMVNTADILLPLVPDQIVSDGVIVESAVATVTATQLAMPEVYSSSPLGYGKGHPARLPR